jgi:TonB family protein
MNRSMNSGRTSGRLVLRLSFAKMEAIPLAVFVLFSLIVHGLFVFLVMRAASTGRLRLELPEFVAIDIVELEPKAATERTRDAASPRSAAPAPEWKADPTETAVPRPVETSEETENETKKSSMELDIEEFPFVYYLNIMRNKISSNWVPPRTQTAGKESITTRIHFVVQRGGQVTRVVVEESSGVPFFDQSALRAVYASDPLPPLPEEFTDSELGVHFLFEFVP